MIVMAPKQTRRYPTSKRTTTKEGKREYQMRYMRDYRRQRSETLASMTEDQRRRLREMDERLYRMLYGRRRK